MRKTLSKLLFVLMLCVINCSTLFAQETITIVTEKVGKFQKTVEKKWKKEKKSITPMTEVTHLTVEGVLDLTDKKALKILFPNLIELDLDGLTNAKEIKASEFALDKLEVLYLPIGCKTFGCDYNLKNIKRIYGYEELRIARYGNYAFPNIPFVQIKAIGDNNITPEEIGWDMPLLEQLTNTDSKINLLVSSMQYLTRFDRSGAKNSRPSLHYDTETKEVYAYNLSRKGYPIDILKQIDYIEMDWNGSTPKRNSFEKELIVPANIKSISNKGKYANGGFFAELPIESVTFEENAHITVVPSGCFYNCSNLRSITLSEGIEQIESFAFRNTAIREITLPEKLNTLSIYAFSNCANLKEIKMLSKTPPAISLSEGLYKLKAEHKLDLKQIVVTVPKGCYEAYARHDDWRQLVIVEEGTSDMLELDIKEPGTLFSHIPLQSIPAIKSATITGVLYDTDIFIFHKMPLLRYLDLSKAVIIVSPETASKTATNDMVLATLFSMAKDAGYESFRVGQISAMEYGFTKMISDMVTEAATKQTPIEGCYIPVGAFRSMTSLEEIKLPILASTIHYEAFTNCTSLTKIEFPLYLNKIASAAFSECTSLTNINLPSSLEGLGSAVFRGCTSLETVDLSRCKFEEEFDISVFGKATSFWDSNNISTYTGEIRMPQGVTVITNSRGNRLKKQTILFNNEIAEIQETDIDGCELHFTTQTPPKLSRCNVYNCTIYVPRGTETAYYMAFGDKNIYIPQ